MTVVENYRKARKHGPYRSLHLGRCSEDRVPGSFLSHQIILLNRGVHSRLGRWAVLVIHRMGNGVTFPHLGQVMLVYATVTNWDVELVLAKVCLLST